MKIGIDDLRDAGDSSSEPEPEQGTGADHAGDPGDPGAGADHAGAPAGAGGSPGMDFTIGEFLSFKEKERRLHEELEKRDETSLSDGIKQFLADPEARQMLKQLWYGTDDGGDRPRGQARPTMRQQQQQQPQPQREPLPAADGGSTDMTQRTEDGYVLDVDDLHHLLTTILTQVSAMKPGITADQMAQHADTYEDQIKQQLQEQLDDLVDEHDQEARNEGA